MAPDIGGFDMDPGGELLSRWLQLGIFHPLYRVHSMGNNFDGAAEADAEVVKKAEAEHRQNQEPWAYGEPYTTYAREAINFRYQLLPFIYTAFWQHLQSGNPIIKSLIFHDQTDAEALLWEEQFLFNEQLLVCPVTKPGITQQACYLPAGQWMDYWSGEIFEGKRTHEIPVVPERIPVFAQAGAIIPNYPIQQYTGEKNFESIDLRIYAGQEGSGTIYEDAGEGYSYQTGNYSLRQFKLKRNNHKLTINQNRSGQMENTYNQFKISILGLSAIVEKAMVDGKEVEKRMEGRMLFLSIPANFFELELQLTSD